MIFEDNKNQLWIGTESNGIIQFDLEHNNFSVHPKNDHLLSNMIMGMEEDDMGIFGLVHRADYRDILRGTIICTIILIQMV